MQVMTYTRIKLSLMDPAYLGIEDILEELRNLQDSLPVAREEMATATANAQRTLSDWEANIVFMRQSWGSTSRIGEPDRIGQARKELEAATVQAERIAEWEARQSALLAALREQLPREEADIDRWREAVEEEERALAAREIRLRELTDQIVAFEGYETVDGRLAVAYRPLIGRTNSLRSELLDSQRRLNQQRALISRARGELTAFERRAGLGRVEVAQ